MKENGGLKEFTSIALSALVLALVVSFQDFQNKTLLLISFLSFLLIIGINIVSKKSVGYVFETKVTSSFWKFYRFGFRKDKHFKFPMPMIWLPLVLALFSKGVVWMFAILEFDVEAKPERSSRRHGMYRFTQVTEWHMAWIAVWGIISNLILGVIAYSLGYELLAKLSIYYASWSMIPFSSLDGTKILFGSRVLWMIMLAITLMFLALGFSL